MQQEQKAKDDALASVQASFQQLNTECTTLGDAVQLLRMQAQQIENTSQGADKQQQQDIGQLNQRV